MSEDPPDYRPSISEMRLDGHLLEVGSTELLDIAAAALAWQRAVIERCAYGTTTYANNPSDITSPQFRAETSRLDAISDGLLQAFLNSLLKVRP